MPVPGCIRATRMEGEGPVVTIRKFSSSMTSKPVTVASRVEKLGLSRARCRVNTTSSAVTGVPSVKVKPSLILMSISVSDTTVISSASMGTG